ncbi:hypothetical protein BDC45DRAFT_589424 [Circinella umbellata]|nr:hypothetical protein BDC45DRAFT_589424 [Circinella umbellata]
MAAEANGQTNYYKAPEPLKTDENVRMIKEHVFLQLEYVPLTNHSQISEDLNCLKQDFHKFKEDTEKSISAVHNIMGRKVDMLISLQDQNISSCEWKANNSAPMMAKKQESKNVRTNCCILESLLRLPYDSDDDERIDIKKKTCITYMDWIGRIGTLNMLSRKEMSLLYQSIKTHCAIFIGSHF